MKTFISNSRKALNSDQLNRKVQKAHIRDNIIVRSHFIDLVS